MLANYLPLILVVCVVILTVVLVVLGIQLMAILAEFRKTLQKANDTVERANQILTTTQDKVEGILNPFHSLSAFVSNFTAGLKVAEGFMGWLSKNRSEDAEIEDERTSKRK